MSTEAVARRYASAIFELGKEQKKLEPFTRELGAFAESYEQSEELRDALANPMIGDDAREAIIDGLAKRLASSPHITNLVRLLARRRRLAVLPDLVAQLREMVDEHQGILRAKVRAAVRLSPAYLDKLKGKIEEATGKKVVVTFEEDQSLIAGIVAHVGGRVVDGSARGKLHELRESLQQT